MNTKDFCRVCLSTSDSLSDLFANDSASKHILENIALCFQIMLEEEPGLPRGICSHCVEELNTAYKFRQNCLTFDERYAVLLNNKFKNSTEPDFDDRSNFEHSTPQEAFANISMEKSEYQCDMGKKILKTKDSLEKHIKPIHEKRKKSAIVSGTGVNRRYHCSKCPYSTPHSQTLVNHMRRHNGERPYLCECGRRFTQSSTLVTHQKTHREEKSFICSVCGKQFKHAHSLKCHGKVHEPGTYTCSVCEKSLKSQKSLQEHMHRHFNIRNFNCEECGATFVSCSDLINHRKKHDSVKTKTFNCHLCDYKTNIKGNLVLHLKRHTGDKMYKCNLCSTAVYTRSELQRHKRVHTHEKLFACQMCGQRFSHSPSLNKHMSNVHGVQFKWQQFKSNNSKSIPSKISNVCILNAK